MNIHQIFKFATLFSKKAQIISNTINSSPNVTQEDKDSFKNHTVMIVKDSKIISDWVDGNVGTTTNDQNLLELKRFCNALFNTSKNLETKVNQFLIDTSTNNTIASVDPSLQTVMQNYNAIRPNYIDEGWLTQYATSKQAISMNQIKSSLSFIKDFIEKQKNYEASKGTEPPLPTI